MTTAARRLGSAVAACALATLARADLPAQPRISWSLTPTHAAPGEQIVVYIAPFSNEACHCSAFVFPFRSDIRDLPCGNVPISGLLTVPDTNAPSVTVQLSACVPYVNPVKSGPPRPYDCFSYELPLSIQPRTRAADKAPAAVPAPAPAPAPAASPTGVSEAGRPALLRDAAPESLRPSNAAEPRSRVELRGRARFAQGVRGLDGRLYQVSPPSGDSLRSRDERFRQELLEDPLIRKAYEDWDSLDPDARRAALQRASDLQARVYGVDAVPVAIAPIGSRNTLARYSPATHGIDVDPAKCFRSRGLAFNAVTHESRHSFQHQLVERLFSGRLAPGGEDASLASAFKASFDNYCCLSCPRSCDYPTYREQLVERDAFQQGETASHTLREAASPATLDEYTTGEPGRNSHAP